MGFFIVNFDTIKGNIRSIDVLAMDQFESLEMADAFTII